MRQDKITEVSSCVRSVGQPTEIVFPPKKKIPPQRRVWGGAANPGSGMITFRTGLGGQPHQATSASEAPVTIWTALPGHAAFQRSPHAGCRAPGGAAVDQVVVQEAVARFVVGEGEDVVYGSFQASFPRPSSDRQLHRLAESIAGTNFSF